MAWDNNELKHPKWQRMRLKIMERDNWTCTKCGATEKPLNVHHHLYIDGRKPWEYCTSDLETVCEDCHFKVHKVKKLYFDASLERKFAMWRALIGNAPKVKRLIEHSVFIIIGLGETDRYCQILHVPSFKGIDCPLSAQETYEKMLNEPESLGELKQIIMRGSSSDCLGPLA